MLDKEKGVLVSSLIKVGSVTGIQRQVPSIMPNYLELPNYAGL